MKKKINLIVEDADKNLRVDVFINKKEKEISRTRIKNLILDKRLRLNNKIMIDPAKKINFGDELDAAKAEAKAWKTIWSAGQGVTTIDDDPSVKELVDNLKKEFISSIKEQKDLLDTYN